MTESIIESELFGHEAGSFTSANKKRIGKIEQANGGTLFLDEIESMPIAVQINCCASFRSESLSAWAAMSSFQ